MLAFEFFRWWYGQGWMLQAQNIRRRLTRTSHLFSVPSLLRTLFSPWKRIVTYPGAGLDAHIRAATDNLVSRFIGFFVRLFVLIAAGVMLFLVFVVSAVIMAIWPLLPLAVPGAIIKGILG